jgi:thiol-disulfide isomerase/thioredoxin
LQHQPHTRHSMPKVVVLLMVLVLLLAACSPTGAPSEATQSPLAQTPPPGATPGETLPPPGATPGETLPPAATVAPELEPTPDPALALPDDEWRTAELRDVRSGETLVVNDLTRAGLLVVIEPMAIWCTSCRIQQNEARTALADLARDDIAYISLNVDPNETEPDLARYADERDYPWHFAVASRDVARSIAQAFGDQVLSPPSTPKIVVARDGQAEVSFGIKRADQLEAEFTALLP